jgi:hypothetical protein
MLALFVLAGCGGYAVSTCPEGTAAFAEYQLFFGRSSGGVEVVSEEAWNEFLADTVTPRFPDGLTVVDGAGQWRGSSGIIERERSKVLIILTSPGEEGMRKTDEISAEYETRFGQETVLRVVRNACVSFS